jgi:NADH dehydrogenase
VDATLVLVAGATGLVGSEVCRRLVASGRQCQALVRETSDAGKAKALQECGATLVTGDLKNRDSLMAACRGARAIISTASATLSRQPSDSIEAVDLEGQLNLVAAAKANGVERFVFVSYRYDRDNLYPLSNAKQAVERAIEEFNYTILRASYFMEIWLSLLLGFDYPNAKASILGVGDKKVSWVSFVDVAEFCVRSLDSPAAQRATIDVGGPEPLSPLEVVRIFEQESGRTFALEHVPLEVLGAQVNAARDSLEKSMAALMLQAARGDAMDMRPVLAKFPFQLTSVRDYAQRVLRTHVAAV